MFTHAQNSALVTEFDCFKRTQCYTKGEVASELQRTMLTKLLTVTPTAVMLCLPASAEVSKSQTGLGNTREDHSARKIHQCELIASHANRGAKHLHAINVVAHGATVDLYNDGHLMKVTLGDEGTADGPVLLDANGKQIELKYRDDYAEASRWSYELSVLNIEGRTWIAAWDEGSIDNLAVLTAATDGKAVCRFHTRWLSSTLLLWAGGNPKNSKMYRGLLTGLGREPPVAKIGSNSFQLPDSLPPRDGWSVGPTSWQVDITNSGHPVTIAQVSFSSGAGRGFDFSELGLAQDGKITRLSVSDMSMVGLIARFSGNADDLRQSGGVETPILGPDQRVYLLVDNTKPPYSPVDRMTALLTIRNGVTERLARLIWRIRNDLVRQPGH